MKELVILESVTFDIEKLSSISIDETDKVMQVALYLENSRHVLHSINNLKSADSSQILEAKLLKTFYDTVILEVLRSGRQGRLSNNCWDFKVIEQKARGLISTFIINLESTPEYKEALNSLYNGEPNTVDAISIIKKLEDNTYREAALALEVIFR